MARRTSVAVLRDLDLGLMERHALYDLLALGASHEKVHAQVDRVDALRENIAEWILDRRFLRIHMEDTSPAKTYEAIVTIGYVPGKKQYVAYWLDSFGPAYSAVGWGTRRGETVEFTFHYDDGPFYNTFSWDAASHQWTSLMENGAKDGQRTFFARDTWSQRR